MYPWIAVALGGAIGSVARHAVNRVVHQQWLLTRFPVSTAVVNIAGCCIIGVLAGLVATGRLPMRATWREFVFVGILGGLTTFSAFGFETVMLVRTGAGVQALTNVLLHVLCGIGGVYFGLVLVERFWIVTR